MMITSQTRLFRDGFWWVRFWNDGPGINIKDDRFPPLFSERNGYRRVLRVGKWRICWLRAWKMRNQ